MSSKFLKIDDHEMHTLTCSFADWYCAATPYGGTSFRAEPCQFRIGGGKKLEEASELWETWHRVGAGLRDAKIEVL